MTNLHKRYLPERACIYGRRMDVRTEDGETGGFKCVHMCACMCARPCVRACDPVCENGMIDVRSDG